jgi:AcrR family transcriptional regulator
MNSSARTRVLDAAEKLFHQEGFTAVTMRDIANSAGIRQASLYYHAPQGKEQLFVETMKRTLLRYRIELENVITQANPTIENQLVAAAYWLIVFASDIPAISEENAQELIHLSHQTIFYPITCIFLEAMQRGEIRPVDAHQVARMFFSLLENIGMYQRQNWDTAVSAHITAQDIINLLLNGLRHQPQA